MLTAEGCRQRRLRLWQRLDPKPDSDYLLLSDPIHLAYLANFTVDPVSSAAGFRGFLIVRNDGRAKLLADGRLLKAATKPHVDEVRDVPWYDSQSPGRGPRQMVSLEAVNPAGSGLRVHDRPGDPYAQVLVPTLTAQRRQKDLDEIDLLKQCMRATDVGHAWARANIRPGMTELDVYNGVHAECVKAVGRPVIVYGDFAVSPGPERRGGGPTSRVLQPGDLFILDYSVVIDGYRSDFTNTLAVGKQPTAEQLRIFDLCVQALAAGEQALRAGVTCKTVYDAVYGIFERANMAESFTHHAGHGLGLGHPEDPYLVRHADQTLLAGDVVTLEPGLYIKGVGGVRIEHNYLITTTGYERLSNHVIALT